jgi:hypothetical protein
MAQCNSWKIRRIEVQWNDVALASNSMDKAIFIDELSGMTEERVRTQYWLNTWGRLYTRTHVCDQNGDGVYN